LKTNLFIAGACKSGTTFLHEFLGQQIEICASYPKEPYFFELMEDQRNQDHYFETTFKNYKSEKFLLDGRHRNMFFSWIPKAIYEYNKDSKIIFILRDPIERAYSHWWMWYSRKIIKYGFHNTIKKEIERIAIEGFQMDFSPEAYSLFIKKDAPHNRIAYADATTIVESGYYFTQINRFKKLFDENQLLIIDYAELSNLAVLKKKMELFLGFEMLIPQHNISENSAPAYAKSNYKIGKYVPIGIKEFLKSRFLKKRKMQEKSRILLNEHYQEENQKLFDELGVEFVKKWM